MKKGIGTFIIFGFLEGLFLYRNGRNDLESFFFIWMLMGVFMICLPYFKGVAGPTPQQNSDSQRYTQATSSMLEIQFGTPKESNQTQWRLSATKVYLFYIVLNGMALLIVANHLFQ